MSQFDFPRINFHGNALLDTPTANNGNYAPFLTIFDQENSSVYIPPRCYLAGMSCPPPEGVPVLKDKNGQEYVPVLPINDDNFQEWAVTPLGQFFADANYIDFYRCIGLLGSIPGYWDYFGDLSFSLKNTNVVGVTCLNNGFPTTYTSQNLSPLGIVNDLLGATFSFDNDFFNPAGSSTSAYLCDVDSEGQLCTQIFYGTAGLYKNVLGNDVTFFTGKPCKSTLRWMNLNRVLNWAGGKLTPMGGSGCFYATIPIDPDSPVGQFMSEQTGISVSSLFMKLNIHQVYEVRNPDYSLIPGKKITAPDGTVSVLPTNPARVAVSGSLCPWFEGDMLTTSICRILKNTTILNLDISGIPNPPLKGGGDAGVQNLAALAPVLFRGNAFSNLFSFDIFNTINEYGKTYGQIPEYSGTGDVPPFAEFENYDFGEFSVFYTFDSGGQTQLIGNFDFNNAYNMELFLASGGMVDFAVPPNDYTQGYFSVVLNGQEVMKEDDIFITTDEQGLYIEQGQTDALYMSNGLPRVPCRLRVFYRGMAVPQETPVSVTQQQINMLNGSIVNSQIEVYDGCQIEFDSSTAGALTFGFVYDKSELITALSLPQITLYALKAYIIVTRTLANPASLEPYLNGLIPVTWDVVYSNVFQEYKCLFPIMDKVVPFTEDNWSDPFVLAKMLQLCDETNWGQPLYMPVTRGLSLYKRQLLTIWANQILNKGKTQDV